MSKKSDSLPSPVAAEKPAHVKNVSAYHFMAVWVGVPMVFLILIIILRRGCG